LVFLKLGGSLITDKARPYTPRPRVIRALAKEIHKVLQAMPNLRLLIGHGSGSFGHQAAASYATRRGVQSSLEWRGFAEVAAAAARLNRLVADALLEENVPILCLQPSASALCHDGILTHLETHPIQEALRRGLIPLTYGDVALDDVRGGTIVSTEELFVYLAKTLRPDRILLTGSAPGVVDGKGDVISSVTPATFPTIRPLLREAQVTDVTGGMADKVALMVELVTGQKELVVHILSGLEPELVRRALEDSALSIGTRITSQ
jgi:isopentenyl phosphate kinase